MQNSEIIAHALKLANELRTIPTNKFELQSWAYIGMGKQFLADYAGRDSEFYKNANEAFEKFLKNNRAVYQVHNVAASLEKFANYIESGLFISISPLRQAQIEVVSDILEQARILLEDSKIHPAAPTVLIGAALEEFLRNWIEDQKFNLEQLKPTIDTYAKILREKDLITKQDKKDIDAWSGNRNNAAHGLWDQVEDRRLINLMLQGVNLFMRKYSPESRNS